MTAARELKTSPAKCVAPMSAILGEGPVWDPRDKRLYWLDIKGEMLFRFNPQTKQCEKFPVEGMVSALGLARSGGFVCATRDGFAQLHFEGRAPVIRKTANPEADMPGNRFNDGKVDPAGGFWAGTMDDNEAIISGSWWRLCPDGDVVRIDGDYKVTNGPAFDPERNRVYLTDSAAQCVYVAQSGGATFNGRQVFLQFGKSEGYPDGMEVDREGFLWIAFWDAGVIRRFSPGGDKVMEISIPALRPTSLAIVEDRIFVTSASIGLNEDALRKYPDSGGLFEIVASAPLGRQETRYFNGSQSGALR
ncbi:MAG: SMP-30/gluconolactonase/LRE family protein [Pseudomonadota bacterium]